MEEWEKLLQEHGYTLEDVDKAFEETIERLKKKEFVIEKDILSGRVIKQRAGRFVTLRQSDYPIKMLVLQEIYDEGYIRIGYYIVSLKKLKNEGKLLITWAQFNPGILKKDLPILLVKARSAGIL